MKTWLISDTHFGHDFLKQLGVRGDNYEREMLNSWNSLVQESDTVIHLGDVAFTGTTALGSTFKNLPGIKVLVRGNHDAGYDRYYNIGFNFVCDQINVVYKGYDLVFSHIPVKCSQPLINIHGHLHGDNHRVQGELQWYPKRDKNRYVDMAPEVWGNRVIALDEVVKTQL